MKHFFPVLLLLALAVPAIAGVPGDRIGPDKSPDTPPPAHPKPLPIEPQGVGSGFGPAIDVGVRAPDFSLAAARGGVTDLADLEGHWSALVFAEDRAELAPLDSIVVDLARTGVTLYGVCHDAPATLRTFAEAKHLHFPLLADLTRQVSQVYGMHDEVADEILPGLVVLDPRGVVQLALHGKSLRAPEVRQLVMNAVEGT